MTSNNQVSPVIRISQGERDASARATHLEAATRKFLITTNERKQMSTTTNFKRIALVAVAALGLGLLSSAPSQAAFSGAAGSQLTVTAVAGTGSLTDSASDSTTAGTVTVSGFALANSDTFSIVTAKKSWPAATTGAATPALVLQYIDTATSTGPVVVAATVGGAQMSTTTLTDTSTTVIASNSAAANTYIAAKVFAFQESSTATPRIAGTYIYTIIATPYNAGVVGTAQTTDITITVAALASSSLVASPTYSTLYIGNATTDTADEALSLVATASNTASGYLNVTLKNASNAASARESVTITTTAGLVGNSDIKGRSVVLKNAAGLNSYEIYPDGATGTATITVSTPSVTFATKTVNFYAAAASKLTATVATPRLALGSNSDVVRIAATDAAGNPWTGSAYIYASTAADALIAGSNSTPVACGYDANDKRQECPITGNLVGKAKMKIIDASTVALATATSNEVEVEVRQSVPATVKISFDKATYVPNERARIYVSAFDSSGVLLPAGTYATILASGGITSNAALSFTGSTTTSDSLTSTSHKTLGNSSSTTGATPGAAVYTVYMPAAGGVVTLSATGGTQLPAAGQVALTASATVTDSGAAALAAVTALATTVASLKTLITTLTNLVLKIQKKVKA